jgi:hypothetical protein
MLGLTLADYALWKWSLAGHHDLISEVAGLTLPLLGAACAWLLVVNGMRLLAHRTTAPARRPRRRRRAAPRATGGGGRTVVGATRPGEGATGSSRDQLAA